MIRIMLVDHDSANISALKDRLSVDKEIEVVGEALDSQRAILSVQALKPDVVLVDLDMPRIDGVRVAQALESFAPDTSVLLTVPQVSADTLTHVRRSVDAALLALSEDDDIIIAAIHNAVCGKCR